MESLLGQALKVFEKSGSRGDANAARISYLRARGFEKAGMRDDALRCFENYLALTEFKVEGSRGSLSRS